MKRQYRSGLGPLAGRMPVLPNFIHPQTQLRVSGTVYTTPGNTPVAPRILVEFAAAAAAALAWRKNEASLKATIVLCESELGNRCNVWFGMMGSSRFSWSFQSHRTGTAQCQSLRGRSDDGLILTYTRPDLDESIHLFILPKPQNQVPRPLERIVRRVPLTLQSTAVSRKPGQGNEIVDQRGFKPPYKIVLVETPVVELVPIVAVPEGILLASAKVGAVTSSHSITRRRRPQLRLPIKTPPDDWYVTSALVVQADRNTYGG
ncbi:uncharacterized protein CLUP02_14799 [Colletotrichum lupini]|uniref:Uncharacterized protein n=1 Tax=Colletotrichum lupini TaxID=145971 RepID=A0A9Q8WNM8_9PEZI|nr:uncharacterized protein CLUP02_14799 [Colletotrichum lupini]UQC89270.1 hypothetical protein CLUP02_14799 [Colletotrichum lupini]